MKRILILVGSTGNLGKSILPELLNGKYDKYFLLGRNNQDPSNENIINVNIGDLTNEDDVKKGFSKIKYSENDTLFLLSTIGGYFGNKAVDEIDYEDWLKVINLNLNSSFLIAKHFVKIIKKSKSGSICFISAKTGLSPEINKSAYAISKNGLNFLIQTLALEGRAYKLSANAIAPFVIDSAENRKWVKNHEDMVHPTEIGKLVNQIFGNYNVISGNVFILPGTFDR